jgi:hypothetical protein
MTQQGENANEHTEGNGTLGTVSHIVAIIAGIGGLIIGVLQIDRCWQPPPPPPTQVPTALPTQPPTAPPTQSPPVVEILHIEYDPQQPEEEEDWQHEFVSLRNTTMENQDLSFWTLEDSDGRVFNFPEFTLAPGASVKVWTKEGTASATDLYWNCRGAIWDNNGPDTAILKNHRGEVIDELGYSP